MKHTTAGIAVLATTLLTVAGLTGTASANLNTPDADCAGLVFTMPRGEEGTVVRTFLDGTQIRRDEIARQLDPLTFTIPSPDRTRSHVWSITVDSLWTADTSWSETVPACTPPPTTTVPPATTTVPAPPVSIATELPPVPTTVVAPPRSTTTVPAVSAAPPVMLPATGSESVFLLGLALGALACLTTGVYAVRTSRRAGRQ